MIAPEKRAADYLFSGGLVSTVKGITDKKIPPSEDGGIDNSLN